MAALLPFGSASPQAPAAAPSAAPGAAPPSSSSNPYNVNFGNIPFAPSTFPSSFDQIAPSYQSNYQNALNFNQSLGNTVNSLYNTTMEQQQQGQQGVLGTIANYGQSARQNIADTTAQQQGTAQQSLINRGLGNFTVSDAATRGINYDATKANLQLDDQIAAMKAGYQNQFIQQNTGQANNQAGFLERMTGQYPNAALSAQLAGQYGAAQQSAANRGQFNDYLGQLRRAGAQGGGTPGAISGGSSGRGQSAFSPSSGSGATFPQYGGGIPNGIGLGAGAYTGSFANTNTGTNAGADYNLANEDQPYGGNPPPYDLSGEDSPYGVAPYVGGDVGLAQFGSDPATYSGDWSGA